MPATVIVNFLTVVHKSSSGVSMIFPDVCKTPSPAGPIPIPYPNVAMSSDTADGSSTVKMDGQPIMLKGSNYSMSSGDEAGSAMGVVSNKNKGKAYPKLHSFDVKVDGDNVFRLTDIMLQNGGSPTNTPPGTNVQPPAAAMTKGPPASKPAKITEVKFGKTKACCGDDVDVEVKTENYKSGVRIPLRLVLGADQFSVASGACPVNQGSSAKVTWRMRRGAWAAEKRYQLKAIGYYGPKMSSNQLEMPTVANCNETVSGRRSAPQFAARVNRLGRKVWRATGVVYGWDFKYDAIVHDGRFYIQRKIEFVMARGADPADTAKANPSESDKARWRRQIEDVFSKKFMLHRKECKRGVSCNCPDDQGCCSWLIRVRVKWAAGHGRIKLHKGACKAGDWGGPNWWYSEDWWERSTNVSAYVRAHEFGHLIGLYDEYPEGACEASRAFANVPDSIMSGGNRVYERHVEEYAKWFRGRAKSTVGEVELHVP